MLFEYLLAVYKLGVRMAPRTSVGNMYMHSNWSLEHIQMKNSS